MDLEINQILIKAQAEANQYNQRMAIIDINGELEIYTASSAVGFKLAPLEIIRPDNMKSGTAFMNLRFSNYYKNSLGHKKH